MLEITGGGDFEMAQNLNSDELSDCNRHSFNFFVLWLTISSFNLRLPFLRCRNLHHFCNAVDPRTTLHNANANRILWRSKLLR